MDFKMHDYTHALVVKVKPGFIHGNGIDPDEARRQYDFYLRVLRELNVEVIEMDFQNAYNESLLLESKAIVCHGIAVLPTPATKFDVNNLKLLKTVMKGLGQTVIEQEDSEAKICGSDVLFTGQEFFVGISDTCNEAGASIIAEAFPEYPCTPIKMPKGSRHMKSYITVAGPDILCVAASKEANEILKRIEREATFTYQTVTVPEDEAANCLYVNRTLIHRAIEEIPESFKVFCERIDFARRSICFSELCKISAGLSSYCLLVRKS